MANSDIIGAGQDTAHRAPKKEYPPVLDVCCSTRSFWFDPSDPRALYCDKRKEEIVRKDSGSKTGFRKLIINPDYQCDFTALPFPDNTFRVVVYDPPHKQREDYNNGFLVQQYGILNGDWKKMLSFGFAECFRVLQPFGVLIFKWAETEFKVSEILKLTSELPLFGHKSGKYNRTHWICFMKQESPVLGEESPVQNTMEICHTAPNTASMPDTQLSLDF